ncbi:serine hydrolase [Rhodococcus globerulus]|uniref:Beta-lactamase-related domain-containing protein n=1 Tax=Rhodococcus globerulus TaxID=33008 RepID=A0ABU4C4T2_RHOGO|nr:serine hydrolase [Rhodococcus globerulus]MDV6271256.1 hypothetical protein [Rhodococcus globerulus]
MTRKFRSSTPPLVPGIGGRAPTDITEIDPSRGWAAGQLISTASDLNQFHSALLDGDLLPTAQLNQMHTTVPAEETFGSGAHYGLGLVSR